MRPFASRRFYAARGFFTCELFAANHFQVRELAVLVSRAAPSRSLSAAEFFINREKRCSSYLRNFAFV